VIGPGGVGDPSLRPNQVFALGLPTGAFSREQGEAVLTAVEERLLTPFGLRSRLGDL
jgi:glycogen debranching enzyme